MIYRLLINRKKFSSDPFRFYIRLYMKTRVTLIKQNSVCPYDSLLIKIKYIFVSCFLCLILFHLKLKTYSLIENGKFSRNETSFFIYKIRKQWENN